jgi:hypothetical protein
VCIVWVRDAISPAEGIPSPFERFPGQITGNNDEDYGSGSDDSSSGPHSLRNQRIT